MSGPPTPAAASLAPNLPEFLRWVEARPRTYADTMDAWRTSCPKLQAWEDAVDHGLIVVDGTGATHHAHAQAQVRLTVRGSLLLHAAASMPAARPVRMPTAPLADVPFAKIMAFMAMAST